MRPDLFPQRWLASVIIGLVWLLFVLLIGWLRKCSTMPPSTAPSVKLPVPPLRRPVPTVATLWPTPKNPSSSFTAKPGGFSPRFFWAAPSEPFHSFPVEPIRRRPRSIPKMSSVRQIRNRPKRRHQFRFSADRPFFYPVRGRTLTAPSRTASGENRTFSFIRPIRFTALLSTNIARALVYTFPVRLIRLTGLKSSSTCRHPSLPAARTSVSSQD